MKNKEMLEKILNSPITKSAKGCFIEIEELKEIKQDLDRLEKLEKVIEILKDKQVHIITLLECEANGYLETYMKYCDEVVYEVIREIHTTKGTTLTKDILEIKIVPYDKENKDKYIKEEFKND